MVQQLSVADQLHKPWVLAPAPLQHSCVPVPLWQPLPGKGLQEALVTEGPAASWQMEWAEKRAMPAAMWDEEGSGEKETTLRGYYEKPLGWERVLLNVLLLNVMLHTNISQVRASTTPFPRSLRENEPAAPWPKHCPLCSCGQQSMVGQNAFAPSKTTSCLHFGHV